MTQEQKDLLLKDICARLPYGVKVRYSSYEKFITCTLQAIDYVYNNVDLWSKDACFNPVNISKIKPYLFPLSSMTEEQKYDFYCRFVESDYGFEDFKEFYLDNGMWHKLLTTLDDIEAIIDWFHKNHFDYRGLIPMGLAIDATGLNIY